MFTPIKSCDQLFRLHFNRNFRLKGYMVQLKSRPWWSRFQIKKPISRIIKRNKKKSAVLMEVLIGHKLWGLIVDLHCYNTDFAFLGQVCPKLLSSCFPAPSHFLNLWRIVNVFLLCHLSDYLVLVYHFLYSRPSVCYDVFIESFRLTWNPPFH